MPRWSGSRWSPNEIGLESDAIGLRPRWVTGRSGKDERIATVYGRYYLRFVARAGGGSRVPQGGEGGRSM